jgi:hypothetical protein
MGFKTDKQTKNVADRPTENHDRTIIVASYVA